MMPVKYIEFDMPDGTRWQLRAFHVAENRARYFAQKTIKTEDLGLPHNKEYLTVLNNEFAYAMYHEHELLDWLMNNMEWKEVQPLLTQLALPSTCDYEKEFASIVPVVVEK